MYKSSTSSTVCARAFSLPPPPSLSLSLTHTHTHTLSLSQVTPICDRAAQTRVGIQRGFIDGVAGPLFRAAARLLPGLAPLPAQIARPAPPAPNPPSPPYPPARPPELLPLVTEPLSLSYKYVCMLVRKGERERWGGGWGGGRE